MVKHMSIRLAWHNNGWNGRICENPSANTYCVGRHSYPGDSIAEKRNLDWEIKNAGTLCGKDKSQIPPCCLSINAFGDEYITGFVDVPDWMNGQASGITLNIPPYTACTWGYEGMYSDDVTLTATEGRLYNNDTRFENAQKYFSSFESDRSLLFYYANYSNPFSDDETNKYVVVGISRLKQLGEYSFYNNATEEIKKKYANGIVWQKPITSHYPEQGLRIPYEKYLCDEEILSRLTLIPENTRAFKYGSRDITDDEAIYLVLRFIEVVDVLIEINDGTEYWSARKIWLNSILSELWHSRGAYPGIPAVLENVELGILVSDYYKIREKNKHINFYSELKSFLVGDTDSITNCSISKVEAKKAQRRFSLFEDDEQNFILNIAPRFDFSSKQLKNILSENRGNNGISSSMVEINQNPYILSEEYQSDSPDDFISVYKIENGVLPSPDLGMDNMCDKDSAERLRAFTVHELKAIAAHTFVKATTLLEKINRRLSAMPEWKRHEYVLKNYTVKLDEKTITKILHLRKDDHGCIYIYLREIYEDERLIENTITELAGRPNIAIKVPITANEFYKKLRTNERLLSLASNEYETALQNQAKICYDLFLKPVCVISGAAGTGKTTILKSIIENIRRVHGEGTSILVMTPTGKATERIKKQTGRPSTTMHSFLAKQNWIGDNYILKRIGGSRDTSYDNIIIDECSMIDLALFATLIRAVNWNSVKRLILVGDPNQLPPIGRGKVFADIIAWLNDKYQNNVGILRDNMRQLENRVESKGNGILELAEIFIQENQDKDGYLDMKRDKIMSKIQFTGEIDKDLAVYYWHSHEELEQLIKITMISDMEVDTGLINKTNEEYKLWDVACKAGTDKRRATYQQLISPYRGEQYGTENMNKYIQKIFNSAWVKINTLDGIAIGDKVLQYRNRPKSDQAYAYEESTRKNVRKEVYNGEIGFTIPHGFDIAKKSWRYKLLHFQVQFAAEDKQQYRYNYGKDLGTLENSKYQIPEQKPIENLELAYAISVHKSQGSEFDRIYLIIPRKQSHLMSMELVYTAITRAQKHLTVFVEEDVSTLTSLSRIEKSSIRRINSSLFEFNPLPEEFLQFKNWYEEGKNISTLTKYLVRSKSEMNIVNILYSNNVGFKYEEPLYADDGTMFLPDFTVDWRGQTFYWEHVGRLDKSDYAAHWNEKKAWYDKHFPGQLIVTYEGNSQTLEIKNIFEKYFSIVL